jgi:hypothetical protein
MAVGPRVNSRNAERILTKCSVNSRQQDPPIQLAPRLLSLFGINADI